MTIPYRGTIHCILCFFTAPVCSDNLANITNGDLAYNSTNYLAEANYTCHDGYQHSEGVTLITSVCQMNETWSISENVTCERKSQPCCLIIIWPELVWWLDRRGDFGSFLCIAYSSWKFLVSFAVTLIIFNQASGWKIVNTLVNCFDIIASTRISIWDRGVKQNPHAVTNSDVLS